ncbi:MAG: MATE family efflux transporter [Bacteroidales bacterium]|nr:MATE family efflux transporter [Candidatus Liminaster caballi]
MNIHDIRRFYYPREYRALIKLGVPIMIGQLGLTMQNLADNIMVGRHSTEELAAAGFVNNLFLLALLLTIGYSIGSVSQIGSLYTQGRTRRIVSMLKAGFVADSLQGLLVIVCLCGLYFSLPYLGQPSELLPMMKPYLVIQIASLPFMVLMGAFRQMTDSINDTVVAMSIMLVGNAWNIFFNWVLIFGNLGMPEMGIDGAAWATFSSRVLMLVIYVAVFCLLPRYRKYRQEWHEAPLSRHDVMLLNRLGWPIATQMGLETASFSLVAILLGWIGTNALAAHQVMLQVANVVFMFYLGVSNAVSIRVSNYNGMSHIQGVRQAAFAGYQMVFGMGVVLSICAFVYSKDIARLFTDSEEVTAIVASLALPLVLYQFGDGMQVTFANALRGLGDVKKLMQYSFLAYIVISLPLSYLFGITMGQGAYGIWMGFPFGLTTAGVLYLRRFLTHRR